jgi:CheY-like chemotaxis protein
MKPIDELNILILEDDRIFAEVLSRNLSRVGLDMARIGIFDSIETENEEFISSRPDVVFLDLNIIGSSGLETYFTTEPLFPYACFIILSGHNDEKLALSCMEAGAQDYISKSDASAYALLKSIQYGLIRKNQLLRDEVFIKAFMHSPFPSVITKGKDGMIIHTNDSFDEVCGKGGNSNESLPIKIKNFGDVVTEEPAILIKKNGEEKPVFVWGGCIDKYEDLYLYKVSEYDLAGKKALRIDD